MQSRKANPLMAAVNAIWAGNFYNMNVRLGQNGPDLENINMYAELKFGERDENWTLVGKEQIEYGRLIKPCYLILGLHFFYTPLKRFRTFSLPIFERNVHSRALWIAPWNYVESLPVKKGEHNYYVYPRLSDLNIISSHNFPKKRAVVYFTEGTDPIQWFAPQPLQEAEQRYAKV